MSDRELDARLAEALGWTWRRAPRRGVALRMLVASDADFYSWKALHGDEVNATDCYRFVPRYSSDPVAFRVCEDELERRGDGHRYVEALHVAVYGLGGGRGGDNRMMNPYGVWKLMQAPLEVKAKAALQVLTDI